MNKNNNILQLAINDLQFTIYKLYFVMNDSNLCLQMARQSSSLPELFYLYDLNYVHMWWKYHSYLLFFSLLDVIFFMFLRRTFNISFLHCYLRHFASLYKENENLIKFCYDKLISHMFDKWPSFNFQTLLWLKFGTSQ